MTTQALAPNRYVGTYPGTKEVTFDLSVSSQYLKNVVTFLPSIDSGIIDIYARAYENTEFELVENGRINLSKEKTVTIEGYPIAEFRFVGTQTVPYTVYVNQYEHYQR